MKVAVLQSSYEESNSVFKEFDPYCDPTVHLPGHEVRLFYIKKRTAEEQVRELLPQGFEVVINLCDGSSDEDRAGLEVVEFLEKYNIPYTGADANFYDPTKQQMKEAAARCGVRAPQGVFIYSEEDIQKAANLKFPVIVKHWNGSGSIGTSKKSKCANMEEVSERARAMIKEFGGALIEEFIQGREYTVLVAENGDNPRDPLAFAPIECVFTNGEEFKYFDIKWIHYDSMKWVPCSDPVLAKKMQELTKKIFVEMGGVSYGRTDLRVDKDTNEPYFLEINPNCGIFSAPGQEGCAADFILANDPMGHKGFLEHIMKAAIRRMKLKVEHLANRDKN